MACLGHVCYEAITIAMLAWAVFAMKPSLSPCYAIAMLCYAIAIAIAIAMICDKKAGGAQAPRTQTIGYVLYKRTQTIRSGINVSNAVVILLRPGKRLHIILGMAIVAVVTTLGVASLYTITSTVPESPWPEPQQNCYDGNLGASSCSTTEDADIADSNANVWITACDGCCGCHKDCDNGDCQGCHDGCNGDDECHQSCDTQCHECHQGCDGKLQTAGGCKRENDCPEDDKCLTFNYECEGEGEAGCHEACTHNECMPTCDPLPGPDGRQSIDKCCECHVSPDASDEACSPICRKQDATMSCAFR